mmetsp:Transcript_79936/g.133808  ORF Transcript_79936/g.133808 Transcript_79936/m.133808 type:complete len:264 (-) Transcript_79936:60-851(-)
MADEVVELDFLRGVAEGSEKELESSRWHIVHKQQAASFNDLGGLVICSALLNGGDRGGQLAGLEEVVLSALPVAQLHFGQRAVHEQRPPVLVDVDEAVQRLEGLLVVPQFVVDLRQQMQRVDVVLVQRQGRVDVVEGLVVLPLRDQVDSPIGQVRRGSRVQLDGPGKVLVRLLVFVQRAVRQGPFVEGDGVPRVQLDHFGVIFNGLAPPPRVQVCASPEAKRHLMVLRGLRVINDERQDLDCIIKLPLVNMPPCNFDLRPHCK